MNMFKRIMKNSNLILAAILITTTLYVAPILKFDSNLTKAITQPHTQASVLAEQTVWRTRIYNGKLQKRLWSYTENRWLTDWIDC